MEAEARLLRMEETGIPVIEGLVNEGVDHTPDILVGTPEQVPVPPLESHSEFRGTRKQRRQPHLSHTLTHSEAHYGGGCGLRIYLAGRQ